MLFKRQCLQEFVFVAFLRYTAFESTGKSSKILWRVEILPGKKVNFLKFRHFFSDENFPREISSLASIFPSEVFPGKVVFSRFLS